MKKPRWSASASPASNARKALPRLARRFLKAGRKVVQSDDNEVLHEFRLATKRFRYALEFFEPVYGPGIAARLKVLKNLQNHLGSISDAHISETLLSSAPEKNHPDVHRMLAWLSRYTRAHKREFRRYWRESIDGEAAERHWVDYLKRYTRE